MNTHMGAKDDTASSPHARRRGRVARACLFGLGALGLIALGAAGATVALRRTEGTRTPTASMAAAPTPAPAEPTGDVEIVLAPEALTRAGIKMAPVTAISAGAAVTVPGSVMVNAYREVKVTPIAPGIVTKVHVELGAVVRRGAPLVTLFSAELAESQTKYMSMSAMLEADHQKLERTRKLVDIGAASRQDLEEATAIHEAHATEVEAARQRLQLLGLSAEQVRTLTSPSQVVSTIVVPAPITGVITTRSANLGQVVAMGQELLSVTDLSEVWVVGDLYEQDFTMVRVGSDAAITTPAYPGLTLRGRVSYIDPRVDPQARTAKARIEVPNTDGRLRLGMYVTVSFTTAGGHALVVPRSAIQAIGDRQVVFVPAENEDGKFLQRQVRLGPPIGEHYRVLSGLKLGESVVTEGSFFLRAEVLRNAPGG
jgi:membrane fusion protein, heavy metal efflux system